MAFGIMRAFKASLDEIELRMFSETKDTPKLKTLAKNLKDGINALLALKAASSSKSGHDLVSLLFARHQPGGRSVV